jgi:hypothetical protein
MSNFSQDLVNQPYTVKIGKYFSRGWEIFKQNALLFVAFFVVIMVIFGAASLLPYPLGAGGEGKGGGGIVNAILSPIFFAGFYIVAFKVAKGRNAAFGDFFLGFNNFLQLFLTQFIGNFLVAIGLILLIIPGIYLLISYMFAVPFVVEKNLDFWNALETSRKLISRNWFGFLGLALLIGLLNLGGALLLGIGLLVTIPWSFCILTAAFEDIAGLNSAVDP